MRHVVSEQVVINSATFSRFDLPGVVTAVYEHGYRVRTNVGSATDSIHLSLELYEYEVSPHIATP